jgi:hypothetical protein
MKKTATMIPADNACSDAMVTIAAIVVSTLRVIDRAVVAPVVSPKPLPFVASRTLSTMW